MWKVVSDLGLGKVANSFIGDEFVRGLSGGEKRRVSIGAELLTRPGVMFLDEPTTGLDSTNAAKVVDILSDLSRGGVTVVMSIHQPRADIFRLLDRILVLSSFGGGRTCPNSISTEVWVSSAIKSIFSAQARWYTPAVHPARSSTLPPWATSARTPR